MPIKSYLAIPKKEQKDKLKDEINQLGQCEVTPSDNREVLIVVTETEDEKADKKLFEKLSGLESLQLLTLVSAFSNDTEPIQS